jgi:hypothetical protein
MFQTSGQTFFDELIRIPDFVASTLASIDLEDKSKLENLQQKHKSFLANSITNSVNDATIKIEIKNSALSGYSLKWVF